MDNDKTRRGVFVEAGIKQLQQLKTAFLAQKTLTEEQQHLLWGIDETFYNASIQRLLTTTQRETMREKVLFFVTLPDASIQNEVVRSFSQLADERDLPLIRKFLQEDLLDIREWT